MKLIDLHVHSNISDGTLSPSELAIYAHAKGLSAFALTDHDTVAGIAECNRTGVELGLSIIPGIELSAEYQAKEIHILGYYIDYKSIALLDQLRSITESRKQRNILMLEKLNALGVLITLDDLCADNPLETIYTRAHFATALYKKGYVKTRVEAFDKYIGPNNPAYVKRVRFTPASCIQMIHDAGGLAVLAHPNLYGFSLSEKELMLSALTSQGLDGLETLYPSHDAEDVLSLLELCLKYKLFPTGGSDFHGENKPALDLGTGYGELKISYDILVGMQKKLGSVSH